MTFKELLDTYQGWLVDACDSIHNRPWCMLGFNKHISTENFLAYFDRQDLNDQYVARYNEQEPLNRKQHSFFQAEVHLIYGFHKSMVARHKTRLQIYRDDFAQKRYHIRRGLSQAYANVVKETHNAENPFNLWES